MKLKKDVKKYVSLFSMLVLCLLFFCGCCRVDYSRVIYYDGAIEDTLHIELDEVKLKEKNLEIGSIKESILQDLRQIVSKINLWKDSFSKATSDVRQYVDSGVLATSEIKQNAVYLNIKYFDYQLYNMVYNDIEIEGVKYPKALLKDYAPKISQTSVIAPYKYNEFTLKYGVIFCESITKDIDSEKYGTNNESSIYEKYMNMTTKQFNIEDDVKINEILGIADGRLHSNADEIGYDKNMAYHYWWNLQNKQNDFLLEFYKFAPNRVTWYYLAIAITGIVFIILMVIYYAMYHKWGNNGK